MGQMADICECGSESSCGKNAGNFLTSCESISSCRRVLPHGIRKTVISSLPTYSFTKGCLNSVVSTTSVFVLFHIYATK